MMSEQLKKRSQLHQITDPLEREKAIKQAQLTINEKLGAGTILTLEAKKDQIVQPLPSGILSLDKAMGVGGYPKGRIIEIFGEESSGKTTIALHAVAQTQKNKGYVAYIDVEQALDPQYADDIGVNLEKLTLVQPDTAEQALNTLEELLMSGAFDLIVVDSVAALTPEKQVDGIEDDGDQAKIMSKALRKLAPIINKSKTVVLFINQTRANMNQMFVNEENTSGGRALRFYATIRIQVKSGERIKDKTSNEAIGKYTHLNTVKNKVAAPYKKIKVMNLFGEGISPAVDLLTLASQENVLTKYDDWYSFNGQKVGKGIMQAKEYLKNYPRITEELIKATREKLGFQLERGA